MTKISNNIWITYITTRSGTTWFRVHTCGRILASISGLEKVDILWIGVVYVMANHHNRLISPKLQTELESDTVARSSLSSCKMVLNLLYFLLPHYTPRKEGFHHTVAM